MSLGYAALTECAPVPESCEMALVDGGALSVVLQFMSIGATERIRVLAAKTCHNLCIGGRASAALRGTCARRRVSRIVVPCTWPQPEVGRR